ncbi:MAG: molybdopterin molybdotransferase MoeA [Bacteroidetes bacterium]|nr:molybdopterin molybdotransferase MoeA [Bacteroidota bacterium]
MISVKDAKNYILVGTQALNEIRVRLSDSAGFALASDIYAPTDFPDFDQSAMDGYGIYYEMGQREPLYRLKGVEQAGNVDSTNKIQKGEAVRIFTGAKIPSGVNTGIQQEFVQSREEGVFIEDQPIFVGMNIRKAGSQTQQNELLLPAGAALHPAAVSCLAGFGLDTLPVIRKPNIIILYTGKEIVAPGTIKQMGQVFESNTYALINALKGMQIESKEITWVDDDEKQLTDEISLALPKCDLLLITGGVSVGDYDYVVRSLHNNGVQQIFHKLKQKPGKPLYFGKKAEKLIFGLPGNPASVLTCFYEYVFPCIRKLMGFSQLALMEVHLMASNSYQKKIGMTHFLKAYVRDSKVEIVDHQESYKMNSFATANAIIQLDEEETDIVPNQLVKVHLLPL